VCGDGILAGSEICDDNNTLNGDGCDSSCNVEDGWTCTNVTLALSDCNITCGDNKIRQSNNLPTGVANETCDDGNHLDHDGCNSFCQVEFGYYCSSGTAPNLTPAPCVSICGDGLHVINGTGAEACDDGNLINGDGCNSTCFPEEGWTCIDRPNGTSFCDDLDECLEASNEFVNLCPGTVVGSIACFSNNLLFPDPYGFPQLGPNEYRCICPNGYYATGGNNSATLQRWLTFQYFPGQNGSSLPFAGCTDIDECIRYGCTDVPVGIQDCSTTPETPNVRTCSCATGTEEALLPVSSNNTELIVGNNTPTLQCTEINFCKNPGCGSYGGEAVPCLLTAVNQRQCICPNILSPSVLLGDTLFTGCVSRVIVDSSTPLGYTSSNSYWTDWSSFLLYDFDGDGFKDIFYSTTTTHDIGWLKNNGQEAVAFEKQSIVKTGLPVGKVCSSPTPYPNYPSIYGQSPVAVICLDGSGNLQAWTWSTEDRNFRSTPEWVQSETFNLPCDNCSRKRSPSPYNITKSTSADFNGDGKPISW